MLSNNLGTFVKGSQPSLEFPNIPSIVKVPILSLVSQWVQVMLMEEVPWTLHSPSIESVPMLVANPSSLGPWPEHCLSAIRTHSYCRSYSALLLCKGVSGKPCLEFCCNNWRVEIFSSKFYCVEKCNENKPWTWTLEVLTQHLLKGNWPESHLLPCVHCSLTPMRLEGSPTCFHVWRLQDLAPSLPRGSVSQPHCIWVSAPPALE